MFFPPFGRTEPINTRSFTYIESISITEIFRFLISLLGIDSGTSKKNFEFAFIEHQIYIMLFFLSYKTVNLKFRQFCATGQNYYVSL